MLRVAQSVHRVCVCHAQQHCVASRQLIVGYATTYSIMQYIALSVCSALCLLEAKAWRWPRVGVGFGLVLEVPAEGTTNTRARAKAYP